MKIFVSAGFSSPIPSPIAKAAQLIAHGNRTSLAVNDGHDWVDTIVTDAAKRFETSIFLVGGWFWRREDGSLYQQRDANLLADPGKEHLANQCDSILHVWQQRGRSIGDCWIEIGPEVDGSYWKKHLDQFHELAMFCCERVRSISPVVPFVTGSTMNFNRAKYCWQKSGYKILKELCRLDWPSDTLQGLHPYRTDLPQNEWPSWDDWDQAQNKLTRVLRGRKVAITEMGWHSNTGFSDEQIAAFTAKEIQAWEEYGAACYDHYQVQDEPAPNNAGEGGFGAYTNMIDGLKPKPVQSVLRAAKERND